MAIRSGRLTIPYDPDHGTPLPRPFLLEGEKRGREGVALKPHALAPKPTFDIPAEISKEDLYSIKWLREFLQIEKGVPLTRSPETTKLTKQLAKLLGLETGAGLYIRYVTGYKHNVLGGDPIPVYAYKKVPNTILDLWKNGSPEWGSDPRKAMVLAKFFYKYGFMDDYRGLKKWMVDRAKAIRDEQKRAYYDWYALQKDAFNANLGEWYRYRNRAT